MTKKTDIFQIADKSKPVAIDRGFVFEKVISNKTSTIYRCGIEGILNHQLAAVELKLTLPE